MERIVSIPNGSIKILRRLDGSARFFKFQFQMVRLKCKKTLTTNTFKKVSIPNGSIKILMSSAAIFRHRLFQFQMVRLK